MRIYFIGLLFSDHVLRYFITVPEKVCAQKVIIWAGCGSPSFLGGRDRMITVRGQCWQK
jgi:hypothetical protein